MNDYVIGLDIGSSKICAAAGKVDKNGELQIIGITYVNCSGIKKGIVVDIDDTSEAIKQCIEQLERMVDISISDVYISLPNGICELLYNKGVVAISSEDGEIKKSDVERVLKAAKIIAISSDKEVIDVIPQQYIVDGYDNIKDPTGMSGLRLEVDAQIILSQTTIINNIYKSVNKAGVKVAGIVFQPLAISQVILQEDEKNTNTAIIDIGSDTTDIAIFKNGKLHWRDMIPLGGSNITNDISLCLKIPFSEAEKLKIKYSDLSYNESKENLTIQVNTNYNNVIEIDKNILIEIINARIEEILQLIHKKLKNSGQYNEISGIVIVGGGISLIKEIEEFGKNILGKPLRIGIPKFIGASNPIYVPVTGIIQDVINTLKIDNIDNYFEESNENLDWVKDRETKESNEKSSGIISKIKEFFTDFF
ncbi:cell division protein FtsA [Clostridium acetireducens DSM 10703]|jgi:cell division protein FtsA|uniref:Cell division protein FtsA n=1 Tax=Clostridium acetireducens DSM 10703 TaxID=1121290 RepID=A0A1E8EY09_9CLOT|nr:cell division protein FtsA [Clostridium acetireducens]OFI05435.1 cell division protein FtsA [Clostridium acetireducens DSM 10703]